MNTIRQVNERYIRANRTIERVRVFSGDMWKDLFIYNYEGVHFRIFDSESKALDCVSGHCNKPMGEFVNETEMDNFLQNFNLTK